MASKRQQTTAICPICNKEFTGDKWYIENGIRKYCSLSCGGKANGKIGAKAKHAKYDMTGDNNPNWKGGISGGNKDFYNHLSHLKYPEKYAARKKLMHAVERGKIIKQPCTICGNQKSEAHHPDYSKPLDVVWLCRKHHVEEHNRLKGKIL